MWVEAIKMMRRPNVERIKQVCSLYGELGTYEKVGEKLGISRQGVEQIIKTRISHMLSF